MVQMKENETKIEKTVRKLDDLYQFYKKIPKIGESKRSQNKECKKGKLE